MASAFGPLAEAFEQLQNIGVCRSCFACREQRSRQFDDQPVADRHAAVHARGDLHVVGGDHHGQAGRADQLRERVEHVVGGVRVEIAGRLVGQQEARRIGDRARDRDPLLLAAGKLRRPVREPLARARDSPAARVARSRASRCGSPRIICGSMTFSTAENSGSR